VHTGEKREDLIESREILKRVRRDVIASGVHKERRKGVLLF
jgi:hypothetical protein